MLSVISPQLRAMCPAAAVANVAEFESIAHLSLRRGLWVQVYFCMMCVIIDFLFFRGGLYLLCFS